MTRSFQPTATARAPQRFPVIVSRTPYTKTSGSTLNLARNFVSRGYVFVAMDVRGRGDSDGMFEPCRNDGQDGWTKDMTPSSGAPRRGWSTGKVGTIRRLVQRPHSVAHCRPAAATSGGAHFALRPVRGWADGPAAADVPKGRPVIRVNG